MQQQSTMWFLVNNCDSFLFLFLQINHIDKQAPNIIDSHEVIRAGAKQEFHNTIHTIKGTKPFALSSWMACFKVSPLRENCSSTGRNLILIRVIMPAFSTEEWACRITQRKKNIQRSLTFQEFLWRLGQSFPWVCVKAGLIRSVGHQSGV